MSQMGRCCRKSRKSNEAKNLANVDFRTIPPLRCSVAPIRRSVVAFLRSEVVPHVPAPETHQQLWKISFVCPKRLFRQHRSKSEVAGLARHVRSTLNNRHRQAAPPRPKSAKFGKIFLPVLTGHL